MKSFYKVLLLVLFSIITCKKSYAFFDKRDGGFANQPIGKNIKIYDFYVGAGAGFNLFQVQAYSPFFSSTAISSGLLNVEYTPYFIFYVGFYDKKRDLRHEIEFNYSVSATSTIKYGDGLNSNSALTVNFKGNTSLLDKYSIFSQKFSLFYNFIKHFRVNSTFSSFKVDFFAGVGIGLILQRQFLYSVEYWKSGVLTSGSKINYINPDVTSSDIAEQSKMFIAGGFQVMLGMSFDISGMVTAQIRTKYLFATKPFFNASMFNFANVSGSFINSHTIGLDMALMIKTGL